jgi:hypothetical protein
MKYPLNYLKSALLILPHLLSGAFPRHLKYSIVKLLFRKGDRTDISNNRPISILTSFSKILEKVIHNRLCEYVINNNILGKEQFGFRINLTPEEATYELSNEITGPLDKKLLIGRISCDLAKAFDCVNHDTFCSN